MRPVDVDFVPPGRWRSSLVLCAYLVLAGVAAYEGWGAWQARRELAALRQTEEALLAELAERDQSRRTAATAKPGDSAAAEAVAAAERALAFPVAKVFRSIESAQVEGVRVVSIEVSTEEARAVIELEYSTPDGLLTYVEAINAGEPRPRWTLLQARRERTGANGVATLHSRWDAKDK